MYVGAHLQMCPYQGGLKTALYIRRRLMTL
jgi:hypothetical protein